MTNKEISMIQKIQIISNNICYGPPPDNGTEVEQHFTVSTSGRIWFNGYNFIGGFNNYERGRSIQMSIGKENAKTILDLIEKHLESDVLIMATDCGSWDLKVTASDGNTTERRGSLIDEIYAGNTPISKTIRSIVSIEDMFLFDGNYPEDEVLDDDE